MNKTRKNYDLQFRLDAAQLVVDQGYSVRQVCESMGVSKSSMDNWVRQLNKERRGETSRASAFVNSPRKYLIVNISRKDSYPANTIFISSSFTTAPVNLSRNIGRICGMNTNASGHMSFGHSTYANEPTLRPRYAKRNRTDA